MLAVISSVMEACSSGTAPHFRPCTAADPVVTLTPFQYVSIDPATDSGCAVFPATTSQAAEYLVVPQLATGVPGQKAAFLLFGDTILPVKPSAPPPQASVAAGAAEQFHRFLRLGDERRNWGFTPEYAPKVPPLSPSPAVTSGGPPAVGSLRKFMVCAKTDCSKFDSVWAKVRIVKSPVAIYVDTLAPGGGPDSASLDNISTTFDSRLYPIDTTAFGRESDIDANGVVLVLMTNVVNKLVTAAQCNAPGGGFVAGFFFGADLDPTFQNDPRSNKGEIFYAVVPDPNGTLSCKHTVTDIQAILPVTFIHEFQHMISFGQHVLVRHGSGEVLWLNEGLSHYAEELGGRSYEAVPDGRLTDCAIGQLNCRFYLGDLYNTYQYLDSTSRHYLLPSVGISTLAERGAAWLFVRYVVDHYAAGSTRANWDALTRSLDGTSLTGAANIAAATGEPFATTVSRWALTLWVTDMAAAPPELHYNSWAFHSVYASLHSQDTVFRNVYPLVPVQSAGRAVNLTGTLFAGSGIYQLAEQNVADPGFTLRFTAPSGGLIPASMFPRLNVIRLQ